MNSNIKKLPVLEKSMKPNEENLYPNCDATVWLRSCEKEIIEPLEGVVTGSVPHWLNGALFRNGPGSLKVGNYCFDHLFDSSALLHRFCVKNGKITYQCRFLQSDVYKRNQKAQRIVLTEFGTRAVPDPCHTIFHRLTAAFKKENRSDNAMISVYPFGDELYAFTEIPVIHRVNKITLDTEGKVDVGDHIAIVNHTSHPHIAADGSVYNLAMSITACGPRHNIVHFPAQERGYEYLMFEKAHIVGDITARWPLHPSYMHTFGITEKYFLIVEQPLSLSVPHILKAKICNEPLAEALQWYKDEWTQINVISRKSGKLFRKFYTDAFFYLHIINQYEMENSIVLDICTYKDAEMLNCMYVEMMKNIQTNPDYATMFRSHPQRFVLPMELPGDIEENMCHNLVKVAGSSAEAYVLPSGNIFLKPERLTHLGCETPRIHYEKYLGKEYRYFYAISADVDADNPGTIIKVDTQTKTALTWCELNCYPSEPVFVPHPDPKFEDDGVVLAAMVWGGEDTNHAGLIILEAKTFKEIARAEFKTPGPVPKCLHGWFLSNEK